MDGRTLANLDEELVPSEVAELCFLCSDVVGRKRLEGVTDANVLFQRLKEKGLLGNRRFLSQLLKTIGRADLLSMVETDSSSTGAEVLSPYRLMLFDIYGDMTKDRFEKMKFLLSLNPKLGRRKIETCKTALDVFAMMERNGLLSNTSLQGLLSVLEQLDQQLVCIVQNYMQEEAQRSQTTPQALVPTDYQRVSDSPQLSLPVCETQPSTAEESLQFNSTEAGTQAISVLDPTEYYTLVNNPRGHCVIINNEDFVEMLVRRRGTEEDEKAITSLFSRLGFKLFIYKNLTADGIRCVVKELSSRDFSQEDALVVFVLSHGDEDCVFGTDEKKVSLRELTEPFTSSRAPSLAEKPKIFFIQADMGPVRSDAEAWEHDFLLGVAAIKKGTAFRNVRTGSIYIQELCKQLCRSAESRDNDDIFSVLTRVNREIVKRDFGGRKQIPDHKYTLTKKLVLKFV